MSLKSDRSVRPSARTLALAASLFALAACGESDPAGPGSDKLITITSPKAGSAWKAGDSLVIQWTVKDPADINLAVDAVDIFLSADGGANWGLLNQGSIKKPEPGIPSPKWGNYKWKIADSLRLDGTVTYVQLKGKTACRVRIEQYTPKDPIQVSTTGDFTINP